MTEFVEVAPLDQVPVGKGRTYMVKDRKVALFNVEGTIYATNDACAHAGASLGSGKVSGKYVTCRAHGMKYDVTTGNVTTGGLCVPTYPAKVEDGKILVAVD